MLVIIFLANFLSFKLQIALAQQLADFSEAFSVEEIAAQLTALEKLRVWRDENRKQGLH